MKIYFIGIGGIGMSSLAQYYQSRGFEVAGSDLSESEITKLLQQKGIRVKIGQHRAENISADLDLVIYTNATPKNNPELLRAKKLGLKIQTYPQALGDLTKKMYTIAVAGMHGKSTTTSMMALAAISAGLDPTVIVGAKLKEFDNSNFRAGKSNYLIIEADEYKAALLEYNPDIAVVLNLEEEHMDFYKNLDHIKKTFSQFLSQIKKGGVAVLNKDNQHINSLIANQKVIGFSAGDPEIEKIKSALNIPGQHNILNALAVFKSLKYLGVEEREILKGLNKFKGAWRRMEFKGILNGALVYDDYGHHPTEIKATLEVARELVKGKGRLWCVFQPHQYHRTFNLFNDFIDAFNEADEVLMLDVYSVAGRESDEVKQKVNSQKLVKAINKENVRYVNSFDRAEKILKSELKKDDVCLIIGAGDIASLTKQLV